MALPHSEPPQKQTDLSEDDRLAKVVANLAQQCNVHPGQIQDVFPCSPLQHALFALSATSIGAYTAQVILKLKGEGDVGRIKRAWNSVIQHNSILRTRVLITASGAAQVVLKDSSAQWHDCTALSSYLKADLQRPMSVGDPLSRLAISSTHLVWTAHHSIYDAHSLKIVLDDLITACEGRPLTNHPPFRSFIRHILGDKQKIDSRAFWAKQLSKKVLPFPPTPPSSRPRSNRTLQYQAAVIINSVHGVTPATTIQAAWALVLSSRLVSSTVCWGTTLSGRNSNIPGIESIVGPTLATVPICLQLDEDWTVAQYLRDTQRYFTRLISHQHIGLQEVKSLGPEAATACDFQTLFVVHSSRDDNSRSTHNDAFELVEEAVPADFFNYALTIQCFLAGHGELRVLATFDENIIESSYVRRLLLQLEHILCHLLSANKGQKLKDIDQLSPDELHQIKCWNAPSYVSTGLPLEEVRKHFQTRADAPAVCSWDGQLSYSALDMLSSRLAEQLVLRHGCGPEIIVPICCIKSLWLIVAVIATLKAGAAFTLLDPTYPQKRLEHIIEATKARTILTSASCQNIFSGSAATVVVVDEPWSHHITAVDDVVPAVFAKSSLHSAMYVVFTSGSTGQPKGVVITHGSYYTGAMGGKMSHIPRYGFNTETRNLLFGSQAFDLCVQEIISTLMAGGCVCVPSKEDRLGDVANVIQSMEVNLASFTSSFARQIRPEDVKSLKTLALVGEPLAKDQQEVWADKLCLLNAYGPSECSVVSTVNRGVSQHSHPANIGHVVVGAAWIVHPNDHHRLVPIGATGELLVDGPHVGRGYLNEPEMTAAAFVNNPRWLDPREHGSRRLYKTGDLVRYAADGSIIFEGRKDKQVKLRGQRVEAGEIEFHLAKLFPHALGVGVELFEQNTLQQLVAFIFSDGPLGDIEERQGLLSSLADSNITSTLEIKAYLRRVLPNHMVPSRYYLWRNIPTLPSLKLDRKKLQEELRSPSGYAVELKESEVQTTHIDPEDHLAQRLNRKVVDMIVARDGVEVKKTISGRDFPLSTLGLDSIQLISVLTFIKQEFNVKLEVGILYDHNLTFSALVKIIRDHQDGTTDVHGAYLQETDLLNEIQTHLNEVIWTSPPPPAVKTVFLTGATGFLGSQILRKLLQDALIKKVIVHARAETAEKALARVVAAATIGKWWSASYLGRIECWPGDLAAPKLGLQPDKWRMLTGDCGPDSKINVIIHNGAAVQWQAPYSALRAANVQATVDLLAAVGQWQDAGSFTYVSGGVKRPSGQDITSFASRLKTANGYSQTKFVAEEIVAMFGRRQSKQNVSIVRPGWIVGTTEEGIPNTDDFLWKLVQVCTAIGCYPAEQTDLWLAVSDVDHVAGAVIDSTFRLKDNPINIVDLDTGMTVQQFWDSVRQALGPEALRPTTKEGCLIAIEEFLGKAGETHAFRPLMVMIEDGTHHIGNNVPADAKKSSNAMERAVKKNVQTLLRIGFLSTAEDGALPIDAKNANRSGGVAKNAFSRSGLQAYKPFKYLEGRQF